MSSTSSSLRWALVALAGAALALPVAAPAETGGAAAPEPDAGAESVDPAFTLSSKRAVYVKRTLRVRGTAPQAAGRDVRVEWLDPSAGWTTAAVVRADAEGAFLASWVPRRTGRVAVRAVVDGASSAQAGAARASRSRTVTVYRRVKATWYGPGFFGRRTACGQRLTPRTVGVAHRRLPCGTKVAVRYGRRSAVVPVIDRGPYVRGIHYDLTQAAAERLGVTATTRIGATPIR